MSNNLSYIFVLSESMLFILSQEGNILTSKRFEYPPCNFVLYENQTNQDKLNNADKWPLKKNINFLITSFTNHLLVYQNFQAKWAAKLNATFHGLKLSKFNQQDGLIVGLNDEGILEVCYLGTEIPVIQQGIKSQDQQITYQQLEEQFNVASKQILEKERKDVSSQNTNKQLLNINAQVYGPFASNDYAENADKFFKNDNNQIIMARLRISLTYYGEEAKDLNIFIECPKNIMPKDKQLNLLSLKGKATPYSIEIPIYCLIDQVPYSDQIKINVSYINFVPEKTSKDFRCASVSANLPFGLQVKFQEPVKTQADFKITVDISDNIPPLEELFIDLIQFQENSNELLKKNVFAFVLPNGIECQILISNKSNKKRIQSTQFEGLIFVTQEYIKRVKQVKNSKIVYSEAPPLSDLFQKITDHYQLKQSCSTIKNNLEDKTNVFRIIQKRILVRYKERNPTPLNNLDILLQKSYNNIIKAANEMEQYQKAYLECSNNLYMTIHFILFLLQLRLNIGIPQTQYLLNIFCPSLIYSEEEDIAWEEIVSANIQYVLKVLYKNAPQTINAQKMEDLEQFKKHITLLIDKIAKGLFDTIKIN